MIRREPFATLVSVANEEPFVTHLPLLAQRDGDTIVLTGHLARLNPHANLLGGARILAIFNGPHGYVSPRWYEKRSADVPTWNYATVHCSGMAQLTGETGKLDALRGLVREMEGGLPGAWSIDELPVSARDAMLGNIVAFTVRVDSLTAKFKLGQNRSDADRKGAVEGLRALGDRRSLALANAMDAELIKIKHS